MMFCGLWHAFDTRFVLWGVYHGGLLVLERAFDIRPLQPSAPVYKRWFRRGIVFLLLSLSAGFFAPDWTLRLLGLRA